MCCVISVQLQAKLSMIILYYFEKWLHMYMLEQTPSTPQKSTSFPTFAAQIYRLLPTDKLIPQVVA